MHTTRWPISRHMSWEWEMLSYYSEPSSLNQTWPCAPLFARFPHFMGRHGQALDQINRARELDPLSPRQRHLAHSFAARQLSAIDLETTLSGSGFPAPMFSYCYLAKECTRSDHRLRSYQLVRCCRALIFVSARPLLDGHPLASTGDSQQLQTSRSMSPLELAILTPPGRADQAFASLEKGTKRRRPVPGFA